MKTGAEYAEQAKLSKYDKIKYSQYDCQAFCELVLKDIGVRQPNGAVYNWKGSNDIARHACSWIGTVDECIKHFGKIPVGAWAFMWDTTGNEKQRGYYDGKGNASHVGIYAGNNQIIHSGSRGVVYSDLAIDWFTDYFLCARRVINTDAVQIANAPAPAQIGETCNFVSASGRSAH